MYRSIAYMYAPVVRIPEGGAAGRDVKTPMRAGSKTEAQWIMCACDQVDAWNCGPGGNVVVRKSPGDNGCGTSPNIPCTPYEFTDSTTIYGIDNIVDTGTFCDDDDIQLTGSCGIMWSYSWQLGRQLQHRLHRCCAANFTRGCSDAHGHNGPSACQIESRDWRALWLQLSTLLPGRW